MSSSHEELKDGQDNSMIAQYESIEDAKRELNRQSDAQEKTELGKGKGKGKENTVHAGEHEEDEHRERQLKKKEVIKNYKVATTTEDEDENEDKLKYVDKGKQREVEDFGEEEQNYVKQLKNLEINAEQTLHPDLDTSNIFNYDNVTSPIKIVILPSPLHNFGVFALQPFAASSTIFTELYAFSYTHKTFTESSLTRYLATLSTEYQELFHSLFYRFSLPQRYFFVNMARFLVNGFELAGGPGLRSRGIFWVASRINHSCVPNATYFENENDELIFMALRDIEAGEEITIAYCCELHLPDRMREPLEFHCECGMCPSGVAGGKAGKKRLGCECSFCSRNIKQSLSAPKIEDKDDDADDEEQWEAFKGPANKKGKVDVLSGSSLQQLISADDEDTSKGFKEPASKKGKAKVSTYQDLVEVQVTGKKDSEYQVKFAWEDADTFEPYDPVAYGPDVIPRTDGTEEVVNNENETFRATDLTTFGDIGDDEGEDFSDDDENAADGIDNEDDLDQLDVRPGVHDFLE